MSKTGRDKGWWFSKRSNRGTRGVAQRKHVQRRNAKRDAAQKRAEP